MVVPTPSRISFADRVGGVQRQSGGLNFDGREGGYRIHDRHRLVEVCADDVDIGEVDLVVVVSIAIVPGSGSLVEVWSDCIYVSEVDFPVQIRVTGDAKHDLDTGGRRIDLGS